MARTLRHLTGCSLYFGNLPKTCDLALKMIEFQTTRKSLNLVIAFTTSSGTVVEIKKELQLHISHIRLLEEDFFDK